MAGRGNPGYQLGVMTTLRLLIFPLLLTALPAGGEGARPAPRVWDDVKFMEPFGPAMTALVADGKATAAVELLKQLDRPGHALELGAGPAEKFTAPQLYERCVESVGAICTLDKTEEGGWEPGLPATAWVLLADGVMVTDAHVFDDVEDETRFGVQMVDGRTLPVTEILAADLDFDVAIFRVDGKDLKPLPLAADEPVGAPVCVISHPDGEMFSLTQGNVTRYAIHRDYGAPVAWMSVGADFAKGSSGGPVLNEHGAVIGMVASTSTIYYGERGEPDDDVQMVVKYCVPGKNILSLLKGGERPHRTRAEVKKAMKDVEEEMKKAREEEGKPDKGEKDGGKPEEPGEASRSKRLDRRRAGKR